MDAVSFRCDAYAGLGEVQGIARLEAEGLLLQYQMRDAVLGVLRTQTQTTLIPARTIVGCDYRAGFLWLMPWIDLRVSDLAAVENIPSREGGRLRLRFAFAERRAGRELVTGINARRAEFRLSHFETELDRMTGGRRQPAAMPDVSRTSTPPRQGENES